MRDFYINEVTKKEEKICKIIVFKTHQRKKVNFFVQIQTIEKFNLLLFSL